MKHLPSLLSIALLGSLPLAAGPLDPSEIPESAQWVVHLDVAAIRASETGRFLIEEFAVKRLPPIQGPVQIDTAAAIALADSISVFGSAMSFDLESADFDGVLVLQGQTGLSDMINGFIAYGTLEGMVTELSAEPYRLLQLPEGILAADLGEGRYAVSRNKAGIDRYLAASQGAARSLRETDRYEKFRLAGTGFAVMALVDGLHQLPELGPQARVLKLSEGIALKLGENDGRLALVATLKTDTDSTARSVRQIVQGALAMARLAAFDDLDLQGLLNSASLSDEGPLVHLELGYAADDLVRFVRSKLPPIEIANDATGGEPVALRVIRSSADGHNRAELVLDDNDATSWLTQDRSAALTLELPALTPLHSLVLDWDALRDVRFAFTVETSLDGAVWETAFNWDGTGERPGGIALRGAEVRQVRLSLQQDGGRALGLRGVRINGATPQRARATATTDRTQLAGNLFDNDAETSFGDWNSPVMVEARIADLTEVREIGFLWDQGGEKEILVHASADGVEWTRILALAAPYEANTFQRFNAADTPARFLKFESPQASSWGQPREIRVYGVTR